MAKCDKKMFLFLCTVLLEVTWALRLMRIGFKNPRKAFFSRGVEGTNKTSASMTTNSGAGDQASYSCSDGYLMLANTTRGNFSNEKSH